MSDAYRSQPEIQNVSKKEYHFFERFDPDISTLGWVVGLLAILFSILGISGWGIVSCATSSYKISDCYIDSYKIDTSKPQYGIKYEIVLARKLRDNNSIQGFATFKEAKDAMDSLPECKSK